MNKNQFHGRKALSEWLRFPLKKLQQKRGFADSALLTQWPHIVGSAIAAHCLPQKLSFPNKGSASGATLHVLCESGWALELQFQEALICERIATFFGYRAVDRLRIHQGALPAAKEKKQPARMIMHLPDEIEQQLSEVADEALKEALARLALSRLHAEMLDKNTNTGNRMMPHQKEVNP